jgi:hypothetical protein
MYSVWQRRGRYRRYTAKITSHEGRLVIYLANMFLLMLQRGSPAKRNLQNHCWNLFKPQALLPVSFCQEWTCRTELMLKCCPYIPLLHRYLWLTSITTSTPTYYIHPPNTPPLAVSPLSRLSQLPIPKYTSPVLQHPQSNTHEGSIPFIPGGGLTRRFLSSIMYISSFSRASGY